MTFAPSPSIDRLRHGTTFREWRSAGGRWIMHWNQMIFGNVRLCVGLQDDNGYDVVYCCGDDPEELLAVTHLDLRILLRFDEDVSPGTLHRLMPPQSRKPMHNDPTCSRLLTELALDTSPLPTAASAAKEVT